MPGFAELLALEGRRLKPTTALPALVDAGASAHVIVAENETGRVICHRAQRDDPLLGAKLMTVPTQGHRRAFAERLGLDAKEDRLVIVGDEKV